MHLVVAVLVIVAATGLSKKIGVAAPLLLVVVGAAISFIPGAPEIDLDADFILFVVLPPLLYAAAVNFPLIDFRRNLIPIAALGFVLVIVSALVIGFVLHWLVPGLSLAHAVAFGAVLSPTDAVSATSVAKRIGLPARVVTILEGESLVNDAAALVLMRTAIAAIASSVSFTSAIGHFASSTILAVAVGAVVGTVAVLVRRRFTQSAVLTTSISFVVPFIAYFPAEEIDASGVIAVVTAGLIVGHQSVRTQTVQLRLAEQTNWRTVQFLLENGVFLLMGYQLQHYIRDVADDHYSIVNAITLSLIVIGILIVLRIIFVFPLFGLVNARSRRIASGAVHDARARALERRRMRLQRHPAESAARLEARIARRAAADRTFHATQQLDWRSSLIVGWSGMRGVVTVAAAQALPAATPYRSGLILGAFAVAAVTLLIGGLTLPLLAKALKVTGPSQSREDAIRAIIGDMTSAAEDLLDDPDLRRADGSPFSEHALEWMRRAVRSQADVARRLGTPTRRELTAEEFAELRRLVLKVERAALDDAAASSNYDSGAIADAETFLNTLEQHDPDTPRG